MLNDNMSATAGSIADRDSRARRSVVITELPYSSTVTLTLFVLLSVTASGSCVCVSADVARDRSVQTWNTTVLPGFVTSTGRLSANLRNIGSERRLNSMYLSYAVWIKFDIVDVVVDVAGVVGMISFYQGLIRTISVSRSWLTLQEMMHQQSSTECLDPSQDRQNHLRSLIFAQKLERQRLVDKTLIHQRQ